MNQHTPSDNVATQPPLDLAYPIDLIVLSVKSRAIRCRLAGPACSGLEISLKTSSAWRQVPGEIVTVQGKRLWRYSGHWYLSGDVVSHRHDVLALGLIPLKITEHGFWDPSEEYWGETSEPESAWAKAIIANGPRPDLEMEQVIPGDDGDEWEDDITRSADLKLAGAYAEAESLLMGLLQQDVRCVDAHVHLGYLEFDRNPDKAARHYRMAKSIGDLSIGNNTRNVLIWGHVNNRPYLRALHGLALCLWRLNQRPEATALFSRLLWLNPSDNQGIRFLLADIEAGLSWEVSGATEVAAAGAEQWQSSRPHPGFPDT